MLDLRVEGLACFGMDASISENDFSGTKAPELIENIYKQARQGYKRRMDSVTTSAMPVIQLVHAM